jgi:large conductance mechanosensitive channel
MSLLREFRDFAMRGNVFDLAVAVVVGGAFGRVVTAMVDGVLMPVIGVAVSGVDLSELVIVLREGQGDRPAAVLKYGAFIQATVDFLIVAFVIFLAMRGIKALRRREEAAPAAPPEPSPEVKILTEIRDALKTRQ